MFVVTIRGIVIIPLVTNLFGAASFGVWSATFGFVALVSSSGSLHLHGSLIRYIDSAENEQVYSDVLTLTTAISISVTAVFSILFIFGDISTLVSGTAIPPTKLLAATALLILSGIALPINMNYPRAKGRVKLREALRTGEEICEILIIVILFAVFGRGVVDVMIALASFKLVLHVVSTGIIFYYFPVPLPDTRNFGKYLRYGTPMIPKEISSSLINNADKFLLIYFVSPAAAGVYSVAITVCRYIFNLSTVLNSSLYPSVTKAWRDGERTELRDLYYQAFRGYSIVGIPAVFGLSLLAEPIISLISTNSIADQSMTLVPILATGFLLRGYDNLITYIFTSNEDTGTISRAVVAAAIVNVVLNVLLIPPLGIKGAAIATFISSLTIFVILFWKSTDIFTFDYPSSTLVKVVSSSILMYVVLYVINFQSSLIITILFNSIVGAVLYFSLISLLGELNVYRRVSIYVG
jgi:O-antigen/teichoic acid export membrane protein